MRDVGVQGGRPWRDRTRSESPVGKERALELEPWDTSLPGEVLEHSLSQDLRQEFVGTWGGGAPETWRETEASAKGGAEKRKGLCSSHPVRGSL